MRPHDELIREQFFPEPRRFEGDALERAYRQRSVPARQGEADRCTRAREAIDVEAGAMEELHPAVPGVEMKMSPVEEAAVLLRKTAEQDIPAKPGMAAVGQGGDEGAAFGESAAAVL